MRPVIGHALALSVAACVALASPSLRAAAARPSAKDAASDRKSRALDNAPEPAATDRDRERIVRMQSALREIIQGSVLKRLRVGVRVVEARTGRLFYSQRDGVLMDPASNQKVLATTTALMRLGAEWRFRTELHGVAPTPDGTIVGDVYLRGNGDPTFRSGDLDALAAALVRRGVRSIAGAVVADPRRIGADEPIADSDTDDDPVEATENTPPGKLSPRVPLVVNHGLLVVRVRPGAEPGAPAEVSTTPADPSFVIKNGARTKAKKRSRVTVRLSVSGSRIQIEVAGSVSQERGGIVFRRRVPHQALYAAALMRAALQTAGITVRDDARVNATPAQKPGRSPLPLLALHESAPLGVLMRKINKDSDNDYAERVLEAAGAEVYGGAPTGDKGIRLLREVIGELGLPPRSYVPTNGSGLGHANRITADAMAALLRTLYLDPRVGPEILQSLSVGGIDGTTRNRFKGTLAAERVRAKTGTLNGKSCLSGLVGDGSDVLVFSIMVEGIRGRHLSAVRGAQVSCVNAMMRYTYEAGGTRPEVEISRTGAVADYETGGLGEGEEEVKPASPTPLGTAHRPEDAVDAFLRRAAPPPAPPPPPATFRFPRARW